MTAVQRLLIYIVPSTRWLDWRRAVEARCHALGFGFHESDRVESVQIPATTPHVLAVWEPPSEALAADYDHVMVWATSPEDAISYCENQYDFDWAGALRFASTRLAAACGLADRDAQVVDATQAEVELATLGMITIEAGPLPPVADAPKSSDPLGFYRSIPMRVGSKSVWPAELLFSAGNDVGPLTSFDIDLTGRARLVAFGPFIQVPAGVWRIGLDIQFQWEGVVVDLEVEWGADATYETMVFKLDRPGAFSIEMDTAFSMCKEAQLRIRLVRAAFAGSILITNLACEFRSAFAHEESVPLDNDPTLQLPSG